MKTKTSFLRHAIALALGLAAGAGVSLALRSEPDANATSSNRQIKPPSEARSTSRKANNPEQRHPSFSFIQNLASADKNALPELLDSLSKEPDSRLAEVSLSLLFDRWVDEDPWEALKQTRSDKVPFRKAHDLSLKAIKVLAASDDPGKLLQWIDTHPDPEKRSLQRGFALREIALRDPYFATQQAIVAADENKSDLLADIVRDWSLREPYEVFEWINSRPDPLLDQAFGEVIKVFVADAPQQAAPMIAELPPSPLRTELAATYAEAVAAKNPIEALTWALAQKDEASLQAAVEAANSTYATDQPRAALKYAFEAELDPQRRSLLIATAAQAALFIDTDHVQNLFPQMDRNTQVKVALDAAKLGMTQNPKGTLDWISKLTESSVADEALTGVTRHYAYVENNPATAFQTAANLENTERRFALMKQYSEEYYFYDPQGTITLITESNLSDPEKQLMLDRIASFRPTPSR